MVNIYTDGACSGNPGPGGYGAILEFNGVKKEISGGFLETTNNRMELMGVIAALEALTRINLDVTIYSDSKYVVDSVTKGWLWNWQKTGFKSKKNVDLWQRFIPLFRRQKVKFVWLKGHAGHIENERCDRLAVAASQKPVLKPDPWPGRFSENSLNI